MDARSRKCCAATFERADGVVLAKESIEPTTPSAPKKGAFGPLLLMARPPLLFKEGNICSFRDFFVQTPTTPFSQSLIPFFLAKSRASS